MYLLTSLGGDTMFLFRLEVYLCMLRYVWYHTNQGP